MGRFRGMVSAGLSPWITCGLLLTCLGCGGAAKNPQGSLAGIVTVAGEPVTEGDVFLISKTSGQTGGGKLATDGKFSIGTVPVGNYTVTISPPVVEYPPGGDGPDSPPPTTSKIPKKYWSDTTSDLVVDVKPGANEVNWELQAAK